jgi:hypothetical protein
MGKAAAQRIDEMRPWECRLAQAAHRDTPPVDVIYRGRSPGLRVIDIVQSSRASSQ